MIIQLLHVNNDMAIFKLFIVMLYDKLADARALLW